jgi:hypothetical protein
METPSMMRAMERVDAPVLTHASVSCALPPSATSWAAVRVVHALAAPHWPMVRRAMTATT